MSFPHYERYKDSGVEWLGEVPEHWQIERLKTTIQRCKNGVWGNDEAGDEWDIPCVRVADFDRDKLRVKEVIPTLRNVIDSDRHGRILRKDDLLLEKSGGGDLQPVGCVVLYDHDQEAVCSNFVARMQLASGMSASYCRYLHASLYGLRLTVRSINQTSGIQNLDQYRYLSESFALPTYEEQVSIAAFLEKETAKIDALIEEQRRLIELLKEKRQAIILHVVTKGLNSDISMKDSCIHWLGEMPQHWEIVPLRFLVKFISGGTPDKKEPLYWEGSIPWVSAKDMKVRRIDDSEDHISENAVTESGLKLIPPGHLLMVVRGMILAHSLPVALTCGTVTINQDLKAIKCNENMSVAFLQFVFEALKSHIITNAGESAHGTKKLESEMLGRLEIPVPPVEEQQQIVAELDREVELLDAVGRSATQAIELLRERRNALISAAVTGKIDVRASVAKPVMSATQYSSGFAHQLLAAEILDRCNSQRMGRIKLQKLIHLCEYHGQISEVQGDYARKAAGPFDARAMAGISKNLKKQKWFEEVKEGQRYLYRPLEKRGEHKKYLAHWQTEMARITDVLSLLGSAKTRQCEIVSTLYAAWNDLSIDKLATDDASILHEASSAERWHKSKEKIAPETWKKALQWMKDKGLVPVGYGKHTRRAAGQIENAPEVAHEPA